MENRTPSNFFSMPAERADLSGEQRSLYQTLVAALSYVPALRAFIGLGFIVIYFLGTNNLLDQDEPRLLIISFIALITAILHLPLFPLIRRGRLNEVGLALMMLNSLSSAALVFFWKDIIWVPLLTGVSPAMVFASQRGLHRNARIGSFIFGVGVFLGTLITDRFLTIDRMVVGTSLTQMAALTIYLLVILAIFAMVILNSRVNFRTIAGRLVTTFTFVALLSSVATLVIAALANLFYDRSKVFDELNAASAVRTFQVEVGLASLERNASLALTDPVNDQRVQFLLTNKPDSTSYQAYLGLVKEFLSNTQARNSSFLEVLLLDASGKTIISTTDGNIGRDFSTFSFVQNSLIGINHAVEFNFPGGFEQTSILLTRPITISGALRGLLSARIGFDSINQIMAAKTGVGNTAETYLVSLINGKMVPITNTREITGAMNTQPAEQALMLRANQGAGIWDNYRGVSVIGSFVRIPSIKAVLIAEIEQQEVSQKTFNISLTNSLIGIFTLLLAFAIVWITSNSVSLPVVEMAKKAANLANGELSTRMQVERQDEIGTLASSFNSMASELQNLVRTLEQKVEDRTQDLQKQANYLRVASEVARDATTAKDLDDLLNQAARLILDRFSFYHTGIFLLDERKEYAILRASPTLAGQEMLSRNHKLKVGQVGMVGNVAATGVPRVALDIDLDPTYFRNPLLPNTRSEVALPLKTGETMVGVIDVQSDRPEAFTQDDIGILQVMADQLALAIQRMLLEEEQQDNLRQLETAYQTFTQDSWNAFAQDSSTRQGYSFDGMHLTPIDQFSLEDQESLQGGSSVVIPPSPDKPGTGATLAVPLKLRDQIIGVLTIVFHTEFISPETISLVEETAGRLATALENARLYTETQRVAERERTISQVSNRLTTSVNIENILRTAVLEIGRMMPGSEVVVELAQNEAGANNPARAQEQL